MRVCTLALSQPEVDDVSAKEPSRPIGNASEKPVRIFFGGDIGNGVQQGAVPIISSLMLAGNFPE
ncbi:hypothetical protein Rwratislav_08257 [Rhodococcus wratislaviensis IFP 2016]|nr:hypothetical protein Rwratislav_08257 [Rhodococcus wratislaviensis IFP 2016]